MTKPTVTPNLLLSAEQLLRAEQLLLPLYSVILLLTINYTRVQWYVIKIWLDDSEGGDLFDYVCHYLLKGAYQDLSN